MLGWSPTELLGPLIKAVTAGMAVSRVEEFVFPHDLIWQGVLATVPTPLVSLLHCQAVTMLVQRKGGHTKESILHLLHCARPDDAKTIRTIARTAKRLLMEAPDTAAEPALRGMEIAPQSDRAHLMMAGTAMIGLLRSGRLNLAAHIAERIVRYAPEETGVMAHQVKASLAMVMALRGETAGCLALVFSAESVVHEYVSRTTKLVRLPSELSPRRDR